MVDEVDTSAAKPLQWLLHTDAPITRQGSSFATAGSPSLRIAVETPVSAATTGETTLMAPGQPGSITKGAQEVRGYELKLETLPAGRARLRVRLTIVR